MTTNAAAYPDPIAAATAIVERARNNNPDRSPGTAAVAALASGVIVALLVIAAMVTSPATIPLWCAAHGGCP